VADATKTSAEVSYQYVDDLQIQSEAPPENQTEQPKSQPNVASVHDIMLAELRLGRLETLLRKISVNKRLPVDRQQRTRRKILQQRIDQQRGVISDLKGRASVRSGRTRADRIPKIMSPDLNGL
jgi:hypothetical protein